MDVRNIINSFIEDNPNIDKDEINININQILCESRNKNVHLYNKSINDINEELINAVHYNETFYDKLKNEYRLIDNIYDLHIGKYVRWFILQNKNTIDQTVKLSNGGFVININKNHNNNHRVLCKSGKIFINFIYEDTIVFQKLSLQEILILQFANNV